MTNPVDSPQRRARRAATLGGVVRERGWSGIVLSAPSDVRWLTGFTGSAGHALLRADGGIVLATDERYVEGVREATPDLDVLSTRTPLGDLLRLVGPTAGAPLGVDGRWVSRNVWSAAVDTMTAGAVVDHAGVIDPLRAVKDDAELDAIRRACAITDAAVSAALEWLVPGVTERSVARAIVRTMEDLGADGPSFPPIVATGPHGGVPHHAPTDRAVAAGDLVVIDVGARVDGYCADMTRTFAIGEPAPRARADHDAVVAAQASARATVRAGAKAGDIDRSARDALAAAGLADLFSHGTGHGVGLDIHEAPILRADAADILATSFTVTIEPGVYRPGISGVRIEDLVLVGPSGAESLTRLPRDLVVL